MTRRTHFTQGIPPINPPTIFRGGFESGLLESHTDFQFDRANRLTSSHNGQIAHLYDAHGRRVRTSQQFFGTRFEVYSQNGLLLYVEDGPTNTRHDYIQFNGQLVAERQQPLNGGAATTSYLHSDLLGSLSVKTANQGSVVFRSRYQAFGAPLDGWRDGPGYTKHVMDSASELVYMQQRYYDPATLRFISTDPVSADPLNFNRYWYANNNPYTYVDPDGRWACVAAPPAPFCVAAAGKIASILGGAKATTVAVGAVAVAGTVAVVNEAATSEPAAPDLPEGAGTRESDYGCIYCVSGENTESGKEYVGSTDDIEARERDKSDGRDREGAAIVGAYPKGDREARQNAEQQAINDRGGRDALDNRRNEVRESRWEQRGINPPPTGTRINRR
jgi:RHS repeat-associated protein